MNIRDSIATVDAGDPDEVIRLKSGSGNGVWRLRKNDRTWLLKCTRADDPGARLQLIDAADRLLAQHFPYYTALTDAATGTWLGRSGVWTLRPFRNGTHYAYSEAQFAQAIEAAFALARLPLTPLPAGPPINYVDYWQASGADRLAESLAWLRHGNYGDLASLVSAHADAVLRGCAPDQANRLLAHGDLHGRNMLFHGQKLDCIIDWEEIDTVAAPLDIGKMLWLMGRARREHFEPSDSLIDMFWRKLAGFFTGEELEALPFVGAAYFLPRVDHLRELQAADPEQLQWYVEWLGRFWRSYPDSLARIEALRVRSRSSPRQPKAPFR